MNQPFPPERPNPQNPNEAQGLPPFPQHHPEQFPGAEPSLNPDDEHEISGQNPEHAPLSPDQQQNTQRPTFTEQGQKWQEMMAGGGEQNLQQIETIQKTPEAEEVEKILEKDMEEVFRGLDAKQQKVFKTQGEVTVDLIVEGMRTGKLDGKTIRKILQEWMDLAENTNESWREQQMKLKTDAVLQLLEPKKNQNM